MVVRRSHLAGFAAGIALALGWASGAAAQGPASPARADPSPGEYQAGGGTARLTVTRAGPASLRFSLRSDGPNGHTCALDGEILAGVGSLSPKGAPDICRVFFDSRNGAIVVSSNGAQACRYHCGARASFEGDYRPVAADCSERARRAARRNFQGAYEAGEHAKALALLQPVLERCAAEMPWLEASWVRNDLALTQLRLGEPRACLATLEPLRADAARSEAELRAALPPGDAERHASVLRATRSNMGRCEAAARR